MYFYCWCHHYYYYYNHYYYYAHEGIISYLSNAPRWQHERRGLDKYNLAYPRWSWERRRSGESRLNQRTSITLCACQTKQNVVTKLTQDVCIIVDCWFRVALTVWTNLVYTVYSYIVTQLVGDTIRRSVDTAGQNRSIRIFIYSVTAESFLYLVLLHSQCLRTDCYYYCNTCYFYYQYY